MQEYGEERVLDGEGDSERHRNALKQGQDGFRLNLQAHKLERYAADRRTSHGLNTSAQACELLMNGWQEINKSPE